MPRCFQSCCRNYDEEYIPYTKISSRLVKHANKEHRCLACTDAILPGESYYRTVAIVDGEFTSYAEHPVCPCDDEIRNNLLYAYQQAEEKRQKDKHGI